MSSDSSDDEDLSKFHEAVDNSFTVKNNPLTVPKHHEIPLKSERYFNQSGHYNDVVVPEEVQKKIGTKVSQLIEKKIKFVEVDINSVEKKKKIKGGVKLFTNSESYLSCDGPIDTYTEGHNKNAKLLKERKRKCNDYHQVEDDKVQSAVVTSEQVLSKEETKCWKSRRKEKNFKYKQTNNSKIFTAVK